MSTVTPRPNDDLVLLGRDPISPDALIRHVRQSHDGAVVTFDGCVRNHSHGRATLYLEYESYESMALEKMKEIAASLHTLFAIDSVAIAHRLGRLEIGETSVFIAVQRSAPQGRIRSLPPRHRHPEKDRPDMEERILR